MVGLQKVETVAADQPGDAPDICDVVERLAQHGVQHRLAGAVRARADRGCDGGEGRGLALAPADMTAARDAHEERVLTAVALEGDFRHRKIEEIDSVDPHGAHPPEYQISASMTRHLR